MSKDFIKKLLKEHLKRIIVKPEDGDAYSLDESFDRLKNINKNNSMEYLVYEDDIRAKIRFNLEFNNGDLDKFYDIKSDLIKNYYNIVWNFIDGTIANKLNWMRVTATVFIVLDKFIREFKPILIEFTDDKGTDKVYYKPNFLNKLRSLFPDYDIVDYSHKNRVFMIKKDYSNVRNKTIDKNMDNNNFESLNECIKYYLYPHKNKHLFTGIKKNDIRKEQVQRIINKLRYLY